MRVIGLLTGRGNNSLKDKNILDVLGHPVLYYPAKAGRKCSLIDDWYCSSDDINILVEAEKVGYKPIMRPIELAGDKSQHIDCILHALNELERHGSTPEILVVLLANNVTIKSEWITDCIKLMEEDSTVTAVVPCYCDNDHHPLRAKRLSPEGTLIGYQEYTDGNLSTNRQDLPKSMFLAHNFWVLNVKNIKAGKVGEPPWSFMGGRVLPYEIEESIDIHSMMDLHIAKKWVSENFSD